MRDLAVHPTNPLTAYVTASGFGTGHVFKTTNGGIVWRNISGNLPDLPTNAILLHPGDPTILYAGTDLGIFRSTNDGLSWSPFNDGLPLVTVLDLVAEANTGSLVAATHGRGMWRAEIVAPLSLGGYPTSRADTLKEGTGGSADSVLVNLIGTGASGTGWTATHGGGTWMALTTAAGQGRSRLRWARDPTGLTTGTYVDTLTVTAPGVDGRG